MAFQADAFQNDAFQIVAPGQAITINKNVGPREHPQHWCNNGMVVPYRYERYTRWLLNTILRWRPKMLFRTPGRLVSIAGATAGERPRWRAAGRTGPMTEFLVVVMRMTLPRTYFVDPYSRCRITEVGVGVLPDVTMHYGSIISDQGENPNVQSTAMYLVPVTADADHEIAFTDVEGGRLVSAMVFEMTKASNTEHGYPFPGIGVLAPIYDSHRGGAYPLALSAWESGGLAANLTTDTDAQVRTRTTATEINLVDNTSTAILAGPPFARLDLRNRKTLSQAGVPCKLKVYGATPIGGGGIVYLRDSSLNYLADVTLDDVTDQWFISNPFTLPAIEDNLYLSLTGGGVNPTNVYAASMYEV